MSGESPLSGHSFIIRDSYLEASVVEVFMHGINTIVTSLSLYAIFYKSEHSCRRAFVGGIIVLMYTFSTIHMALVWTILRTAFVIHGQTESTILANILVHPVWQEVLGSSVFVANTFTADCVLIWRCWTVWESNWKVVSLPMLSTITGTVFAVGSLVQQSKPPTTTNPPAIDWSTCYFSLSLATTLLSTALIVIRIVLVIRRNKDAGLSTSSYRRVVRVVVESAMLYSMTFLVFAILYARDNFNSVYPQGILVQMTAIAPALMLTRVSFARDSGRTDKSWSAPIQFRPSSQNVSAFDPSATTVYAFRGSDNNVDTVTFDTQETRKVEDV